MQQWPVEALSVTEEAYVRLPVLADSPDTLADLRIYGDLLRYHEHAFPLALDTSGGSTQEVH